MDVKELLARNRCNIWRFKWLQRDSNPHSLRKRILNHLARLPKWLSCVVSTYLYSAFDSMLLSMSHTRLRSNLCSIVASISRNSLLEIGAISEVLSDCNWIRTNYHLVRKWTLNTEPFVESALVVLVTFHKHLVGWKIFAYGCSTKNIT